MEETSKIPTISSHSTSFTDSNCPAIISKQDTESRDQLSLLRLSSVTERADQESNRKKSVKVEKEYEMSPDFINQPPSSTAGTTTITATTGDSAVILTLPVQHVTSSDCVRQKNKESMQTRKKDNTTQKEPSGESINKSKNNLASLPSSLAHLSGSNNIDPISCEDNCSTSLPDLGSKWAIEKSQTWKQLQDDQSSSSQLGTLQMETILVKKQLQHAQEKIASIEREKENHKAKAKDAAVEIRNLEENAEKKIIELHSSHAEGIAQVKKQARQQLERERLLNQIRELTIMKESATAEVETLKGSLIEAQEIATTKFEKHELRHKTELDNMKAELQALQKLCHNTEMSLQMKSEERICELSLENKRFIEKCESRKMSDDKLKLELAADAQLQRERTEAVTAVEQNDSAKVKQQKVIDEPQKDVKSTDWDQQNQGGQRLSRRRGKSKTSPVLSCSYLGDTIVFKNKRSHTTIPYSSFRHRKYEGSLSLKQEWQREREKEMEKKVRAMDGDMFNSSQREAKSTQGILKKKLEQMLQKDPLADDLSSTLRPKHNSTMRPKHQHHVIFSENQELKGKLVNLKDQLMNKSVQLQNLEDDLVGTKKEASLAQSELLLQRHAKNMLHSKVDTLENKLMSQKKELISLQDDAVEKLSTAGSHLEQTRQEVSSLKAKVGELEEEVSNLSKQLDDVTIQKNSLQMKLDTISSQRDSLESQLIMERAISSEARSKLDTLDDDRMDQGEEFRKVTLQCNDLKREVFTVRRELRISKENITCLEDQLMKLEAKYDSCHADLTLATRNAAELEGRLQSTISDLAHYQDLAQRLQDTITVTQHDLEMTSNDLEIEKQTNRELQAIIDTMTNSGKRMEGLDALYTRNKKELALKNQELQQAEQDNYKLKAEIKQLQDTSATLHCELEGCERELRSQELELTDTKEMASVLQKKLITANSNVDNSKKMLTEFKDQLKSNEFENSRLMKENEASGCEIQDVRSKLLTASRQLAETKMQLDQKETLIKVLKQEKNSLTSDLSEAKNDLHLVVSSKNELEADLEFNISQLEIEKQKSVELQKAIKEKMDLIRSLNSELEKMQCTFSCEREQNETLGIEHANVQGKLQSAREESAKLRKMVDEIKQESESNLKHDQQVISELKAKLSHIMDHMEDMKEKGIILETENEKNKEFLRMARLESTEAKTKLSMMTSELNCTIESKENLEEQQELLQQELDNANSTVANKVAELEQTADKLFLCQSELSDALQVGENLKVNLSAEKANTVRLKSELAKNEDILIDLKLELKQVREERDFDKQKVEKLSLDIIQCQTKNQELNRGLHSTHEELIKLNNLKEEADDKCDCYLRTISLLKTKHEEEKEILRSEHDHTKEQLSVMEENLGIYENKLTACSIKLANMQQKCAQLEDDLKARSEVHSNLKAINLNLESRHDEAKCEIAELNKKLASKTNTAENYENELRRVTDEYASLKAQLQLQREAAATSLNRIQKHNQEKCSELHSKIQQLSDKIKEAHTSLRDAQQELMRAKAENNSLSTYVTDENEKNKLLKEQLQEQMTALRLKEQKMEQYRRTAELERSEREKLQVILSDERIKLQKSELSKKELKQAHDSLHVELNQCQNSLTKERTLNDRLSQNIQQLKDDLSQTKRMLESVKEMQKDTQLQGEKEMSSLRQKYHTEKKALKDKLKQLHADLQTLTTQFENRGDVINKLEITNKQLAGSHREAVKKLSHCERKFQDKKDECGSLKIKLKTLEVQVTQLQAELTSLEKAQFQLDEFKKKSEAKSKVEMQRVLAEVTEHMEQQYSAHKYLDKLRSENEMINIKEKERLIAQLKTELKQKKQECKQDRLKLEQMHLESSYLRNQQKEQDRSRRRLEARLEEVNDTLSRTLPNPLSSISCQFSGKPGPLYSSTPTPSRTYHTGSGL